MKRSAMPSSDDSSNALFRGTSVEGNHVNFIVNNFYYGVGSEPVKQTEKTQIGTADIKKGFTDEEIAAREAKETIYDEWHKAPHIAAQLKELMAFVLRVQQGEILIAHHLCYKQVNQDKEIASATDFLFDHQTLRTIFGAGWIKAGQAMVEFSNEQRVAYLHEAMTVASKIRR